MSLIRFPGAKRAPDVYCRPELPTDYAERNARYEQTRRDELAQIKARRAADREAFRRSLFDGRGPEAA